MGSKPVAGNETPRSEKEPAVVLALARRELPEDLLKHTEECAVCCEVRSITLQLQDLLDLSMEAPLEIGCLCLVEAKFEDSPAEDESGSATAGLHG